MTSEIRTNSLKSRAGLSTVTLTDSGPMFSGITTFVDNSGFNIGTGSSIFSPATNTLTFGTNSNERLRIDSSGNVTISTGNLTIPDSIIHSGDTDTKIVFTDNNIDFQAAGSNRLKVSQYAIYVQTGLPLAFLASSGATPNIKSGGTNNQDLLFTTGTGNPTRLQITSAGSVGIGTNTPRNNSKLDVHNSTSSGVFINYDGQSNTEYGLRIQSNAAGGNFESDFLNGTTALLDLFANSSSTTGGDLLVARTQSSTPVFLIKGDGKVGIGSAVPKTDLDIGNTAGGTITLSTLDNSMTTDQTIGKINFYTTDPSGDGEQNSAIISAHAAQSLGAGGYLKFSTAAGGTGSEGADAVERLRITSAGTVNIGESSTQTSVKLHVDSGTTNNATVCTLRNDSTSAYATNDGGINTPLSLYSDGTNAAQSVGIQFYLSKSGETGCISEIGATRESNGNSTLVFRTRDSSTGRNERVRIKSDGKIQLASATANTIHTSSDASKIAIFAGSTDSVSNGGVIAVTGVNHSAGCFTDVSAGTGGHTQFRIGTSEKLRITTGNVQLAQNIRLESKPNSTWGAGFMFGGNGYGGSSTHASCVATNGNVHIDARSGSYGMYLNWYAGGNGTYFGNSSGGQAGRIDSSGNLALSGTYPGSDLRLKENIQNISGATDTIKSLVGKTFTWKAEAGLDSYKHYGFIAQEVQKVAPDLVKDIGCHYFDKDDKLVTNIDPTESDEDRKSAGLTQSLTVNNEGVIPILVEAMKELIVKVETLEQENITLRARVTNLEGE